MQPIYISRVFGRLQAVVLLFGLATAPNLPAQNGDEPTECSNALLNGWYNFGGTGIEAIGFSEEIGLGGIPATAIGSFHADGEGKITTFRVQEAVSFPPEFMGFFVLERDPIAEGAVPDIDYRVESDCTGTISRLDQTPFEPNVPTELPFVLVDGGRGGWALRTKPPSTFLLTFKRVDSLDQQIESKVDEMSVLLKKVASRLGLPLDP